MPNPPVNQVVITFFKLLFLYTEVTDKSLLIFGSCLKTKIISLG